jgi:hypothetical protein
LAALPAVTTPSCDSDDITELSSADWGNVLGGDVLATAILNHLFHSAKCGH